MNPRLTRFVVLSATAFLCGADAADDAKKDAKQLQGKWTLISAIRSGQEYPPEKLKGEVDVIFAGDTVQLVAAEKEAKKPEGKITFKLDPTKKPKTIDMIPSNQKFEPILGIYELTGDQLKICFRPSGDKRPTEFKSETNSGCLLYVLKRLK
jgi:uncharacterized protein (TIGR03067 family)